MIARKIVFTYFGQLLISGVGFIALIFIGHFMGPTPLGIVAYGMAFIGMFRFIPDLGFNAAHVKRLSEGKDPARCNGTFLTTKAILTVVMVLAVLIVIATTNMQGPWVENPEQLTVVYILLVFFVLQSLGEGAQYTFQAGRESVKEQLPQMLRAAVRLAAVIVVALAGMGVIALASSYVLGGLALVLASLLLIRSYPLAKPSWEYFKSYFSFALPVAFYSVIVFLNISIDKLMIGNFYGVNEVAFYFSGEQFIMVIVTLSASAGILLFPTISVLHARNDMAGIRQVTNLSERYLSIIITPLVVLCAVFAAPLISIALGDEFLPAAPIFRLLLIVTYLSSINISYSRQMEGTNRPGLGVKVASVNIILNIILNLIFIPDQLFGIRLLGLGAMGAAMATAISFFPAFLLMRFYAYKITGTRSNWRILLHLFAAGVAGVGAYFASLNIAVIQWYHLIGFGIAFMAVYFGILYLVREFTGSDFRYLLDLLNPRKMKDYAKSELKKPKDGGNDV